MCHYTTRAYPINARQAGPWSSTFRGASIPAFHLARAPETCGYMPSHHRIPAIKIRSFSWELPPGQLATEEDATVANMTPVVIFAKFLRDSTALHQPSERAR